MKTSAAGLAFVAREEGTVLHTYIDVVGVPTIGVGHALRPGESFPNGITMQQAMDILSRDIGTAEGAVNSGVKVPITQEQFDAMVSFTFNCGTGAFKGSGILKKLNAGDIEGAADEFLKWTHGGGKELPGLVARRKRERALFLKGIVLKSSIPKVALPSVPGESPGDKLVRLVRSCVGLSLSSKREDLGMLVARGVDKPEAVVGITTNCATTALGIMAEAGVKHKLLNQPYVSGMAVAWIRQIGQDLGALVKYDPKGPQPKPGSLLRYNTAGKNDDHVEWLLTPIGANGEAEHAGGGRADNAITAGTGNVLTSWGRPLVEWLDPDKLMIDVIAKPVEPEAPETPVVPEPAPEPEPEPVPLPEPLPGPPPAPIVVTTKPAWKSIVDFVMMLIGLLAKRGK